MSELYTFDALKEIPEKQWLHCGDSKGYKLIRVDLKKLILMVKLILNQQEYSI